mmetsp:Transcript_14335/g.23417  ORF Transcript_14335/g.23417 Transcript_14335/m.23417 type:complete len:197 (+) Transcript_14335:953-1543(+)
MNVFLTTKGVVFKPDDVCTRFKGREDIPASIESSAPIGNAGPSDLFIYRLADAVGETVVPGVKLFSIFWALSIWELAIKSWRRDGENPDGVGGKKVCPRDVAGVVGKTAGPREVTGVGGNNAGPTEEQTWLPNGFVGPLGDIAELPIDRTKTGDFSINRGEALEDCVGVMMAKEAGRLDWERASSLDGCDISVLKF